MTDIIVGSRQFLYTQGCYIDFNERNTLFIQGKSNAVLIHFRLNVNIGVLCVKWVTLNYDKYLNRKRHISMKSIYDYIIILKSMIYISHQSNVLNVFFNDSVQQAMCVFLWCNHSLLCTNTYVHMYSGLYNSIHGSHRARRDSITPI